MLMFGATENMTMEERTDLALKEGKCVFCGSRFKDTRKTGEKHPGAFYSGAGMREIAISGVCEHCFDQITGI